MQVFLSELTQFSSALDRTVTLAELLGAMQAHSQFVLNPASEEGVNELLKRDDLAQSARVQLQLMERLLRESRLHGLERAAVILATRVLIVRLASAADTDARIAVLKERADVVRAVDEESLRLATHPAEGAPPTPQAFAALQELFAGAQRCDFDGSVRDFEKTAAHLSEADSGGNETSTATSPTESASHAPATDSHRAARLIGHWRHTEALSSRDVSVVTDHHFVIKKDGDYEAWSHTVSAAASYESTSEVERGRWELAGEMIMLRVGEAIQQSRVAVDGKNLLMKDWSARRIWERLK